MANLGIKDIAALAKVSPATVSRALSAPGLLSKKTRRKVMKIIEEVGYRPNRLGVSLRTRKSGNIVAIIPDITNPVNAGIIRAIEHTAQRNNYSILLGDTQGLEEQERHYAELVASGQADGILLFCARLPFKTTSDQPLMEQLPPIVNGNERIDTEELVQVTIENTAAAQAAVEHLLSLGHTRIAAVTGPSDVPSSNERLKGYSRALDVAGITRDQNLIEAGTYDVQSGMSAANRLLLLRDRPTAIFCFNDDMAIGVMKFLQERGLSIPQDVSVMGFDDINYAALVSPSLTTVHQPLEEIGQACVSLLLKQLKGEAVEPCCQYLPFQIKIRESTGPAPRT